MYRPLMFGAHRRRLGRWRRVKAALHDADTDIFADIVARIVARMSVSMSVSYVECGLKVSKVNGV